MKTSIIIILMLAAYPLRAAELTLNQQLILACYKLQVDKVVTCLRKGANVNGRFGECAYDLTEFHDRWTGGLTHISARSWTPLIALASSPEYPDPPAELGDIWKDPDRSLTLQKQIPKEQIKKRRKDTMVILYILLSHGCNLDDDDGYGATALYNSVDNDKIQMAKILLQYGANPNTKTKVYIDGPGDKTPLHIACRSQELVQLLLDHGADADAKDDEGKTPADWIKLFHNRTFDLVKTPKGWRVRPCFHVFEKSVKPLGKKSDCKQAGERN